MGIAALAGDFRAATLPPETDAFRYDVRAFLEHALKGMRPHERARTWTGWNPDFSRALAQRGWVGLTLPTAYGGAARDYYHRFVLVEELLAHGAPCAAHWIGDRQSAPLLLKFGTEEQRQRFIPAICRSELFFCIGMSEPGSGSDLASVRSRAVRDGNGWRLSGAKLWTTWGHKADMMIALVRTSGSVEDRQKGLSQFLVDLKAPGVTVKPITLMTGESEFSETRFDEVFLPAESLVGEEGQGWAQVNAELAFERSGPERIYSSLILLDLWTRSLGAQPDARAKDLLGRHLARLATLRAMSVALTARLVEGASPVVGAALLKDLGTAFEQAIPSDIANMIEGPVDPELMSTLAYLHQLSATFSIRGGTREILRGMIARGMGLR